MHNLSELHKAQPPLDTRLKYQYLIDELGVKTPCPNRCKPKDLFAYRFVKSTEINPEHFLPTEIEDRQNGRVRRVQNESKKCLKCAISLYDSAEKAKDKLKFLSENYTSTFGTMLIAIGFVNESDGIGSEPDSSGHFSYYEYINSEIYRNFSAFNYIAGQ